MPLLVVLGGFLSGLLATLAGVGGAVITTPFIRVLGATPLAAVGSTVPAILPGALTGVVRYEHAGLVRREIALTAGLAGMLSAVVGGWVADVVDARYLMVLTAVLVLWSGVSLVRGSRDATVEPTGVDPPRTLIIALGLTAGLLAGLLGVGGGIVLTPGLTLVARLPVKQAIATSLGAVAMMSVASLTTHIVLGHVDWSFAIPLAIGVVPGALTGARVTVRAPDHLVRLWCGILLTAVAVLYMGREISGIVTDRSDPAAHSADSRPTPRDGMEPPSAPDTPRH